VTTAQQHTIGSRLPHTESTGRTWSRDHARSERTNDAEVILKTVSRWDSNFVILSPVAGGDLKLETWLDPDAVDDFYNHRVLHRHHTLAQYCVNEFNTPWYQFTEQIGDLLWIETGKEIQVHVVGLFPVWVDGIIGEICWHAPEWTNRPFDAGDRIELSRRLDAFDVAWRSGDLDMMAATVGDRTTSVIRVVEVDGDRRHRAIAENTNELREAWSAPAAGRVLELERLHQIITNWYVFAAYRLLVEVSGRTVVRETARILPVGPDGKFMGELSYSMEIDV